MLGNHGLWAKRLYYEQSANVPMILLGGRDGRVPHHTVDDRLVGWQDVMPTLLDLAGIDIPDTVEGLSMVGEERRSYLYGECGEGANGHPHDPRGATQADLLSRRQPRPALRPRKRSQRAERPSWLTRPCRNPGPAQRAPRRRALRRRRSL